MSKRNIIVDTGVWYSEKKFIFNNKNRYNFIITFPNLDELSKTERIKKEPGIHQKALKHLADNDFQIIYNPPFVHIYQLQFPSFYYDFKKRYSLSLQILDYLTDESEIDPEVLLELENYISSRERDLQSVSDYFNELAVTYSIQKQSHGLSKYFGLTEEVFSFIQFYTSHDTKTEGITQEFKWEQIELFQSVLKEYFRRIESKAWTSTANDWYDVFLFAYVDPYSMVWMKENKWVELINNIGLSKYLFSPDTEVIQR
ncbi:MAG: hypothetical protein NTY96_05370 [Bacteroidetes bacterium]|nr:hypothetical protein [Bacteroidota bacterium]